MNNSFPMNLKSKFRILQKENFCYLDSAASTLSPDCVVKAMNEYYYDYRANLHSNIYPNAVKTNQKYLESKQIIADFIGAKRWEEIIITKNSTDGINQLALMLSDNLEKGDEIILSYGEHHSNLLIWQRVAERKGVIIKYVDINQGIIKEEDYLTLITSKTKIVALTHISNVLGTLLNLDKIIKKAHLNQALVVLDSCQSIAHIPIDVTQQDIDFMVFSGHKLYGPTGVGVLYGKYKLLQNLIPNQLGGGMVSRVNYNSYQLTTIPERFEAGTPSIAEVIGLARAISFVQKIGFDTIMEDEKSLMAYAIQELRRRKYITIYGSQDYLYRKTLISFNIKGIHQHDIAQILADDGICVRVGFHCAEPLAKLLNINGSVRISFGIYTTKQDLEIFFNSLDKVYKIFCI